MKKEEITDLIADHAYDDPEFKPGLVLRFSQATIKVTKVDRKNKRCWGQHVELVKQEVGLGHYKHNIDTTEETVKEFGVPYCTDCEVPINEQATLAGKQAAVGRQERTLEDGTVIDS